MNSNVAGQVQKLAVDKDGRVHLIYSAGQSDEPYYLWQDAEGWRRERIAGASNTDALALDSSGRPYIAFADAQGLHYGLRNASGWHFQLVAPAPASSPSLALDAQDRPRLAWVEPGGIVVAALNDGAWAREAAYAGGAGAPALALDATGSTHVAFSDTGAHLRYVYPHSGAWYRAYPAPLAQAAGRPSLAIDGQGNTYLGLLDRTSPGGSDRYRLQIAVRRSREWRTEQIADCGEPECAVSLAAGAQGAAAAYLTRWPSQLVYARPGATGWQQEVVASNESDWDYISGGVSLAFDPAGRPFISYYDQAMHGIRILRWVEVPPTPTPTSTNTATPRPTQTPSLTCLTPTPAPTYSGVPPSSGSIARQVKSCADDTYVRVDTQEILYDLAYVRTGARDPGVVTYVSAFLFRDVRIPRGAHVTTANLQVQPDGSRWGEQVQVTIAGELHGQAGDFNPNNWAPQDRSRTLARVPWTFATSVTVATDSPDISAIIEEIVALPDWRPGNNIAIFLDPTAETNAWIGWQAYDGKPAAAARLSLSYQPK